MNEVIEQVEIAQTTNSEELQDVSIGDVAAVDDNSSVQDVSSGDLGVGDSSAVYITIPETETVYLWESDIAEYSTTDGLLLLILVVLILQLFFKRW